MSNYRFGAGRLFLAPISGVGPSFEFATLQDVSVDFTQDIKMLTGSYDSPDVAARGKMKTDIKAKFGLINMAMLNAAYLGATVVAGATLLQMNEAGTVPASTTYTIVAGQFSGSGVVAGSLVDLQVRYAATGALMTNSGAVAPVQGQYQFTPSTGTYTFAAADASVAVLLTYRYTTSATTSGTTYQRKAQLMGSTLYFQLFLYNSFNGTQQNMLFYRAMAGKLSNLSGSKNDDFSVPELDISVFNDPAGRLFDVYDQVGTF